MHLGVDNQGAVDHLRDILKGVFNPSEVKHEDLWIDIASCIRATPADIRVHKVASHDQESFEKHPLKTLQENGKTMLIEKLRMPTNLDHTLLRHSGENTGNSESFGKPG